MLSAELSKSFTQTRQVARVMDRCGQLMLWAALADWWRRLWGEATDLLRFEDVMRSTHSYQKLDRGLHSVPLCQIVGSVGRSCDFTRDFLPRRSVSPQRWARIDRAFAASEALPVVELYQVGEVYFVVDGHHRISVARDRGLKEIEAAVTALETPLPLTLEWVASRQHGQPWPPLASRHDEVSFCPSDSSIRRIEEKDNEGASYI